MSKESHWLRCPKCHGKTKIKITDDTVLLNFPLFCPVCRREFTVGVIKLKMHVSREPDV